MNPDAPALFRRKTRQRQIVEVYKTVEQLAGRINLHGQPCLGKVDLHLMRSLLQAPSYLGFMLAQQIFDEFLARIIGNVLGRVHQAQRRRRYHRLLYRHVRITHRDVQERICVASVTERPAREAQHAARVTV